MTKYFHRELDKIKKKIISLGILVEEQVRMSINAFRNEQPVDVEDMIESDKEIDRLEIELEEECLKVLALYQPVATDLRFLIALIKINADLERIGDLAVNICRRVDLTSRLNTIEQLFNFSLMTEKVEAMLSNSLDALVRLDVDLAATVVAMDDVVDELQLEAYNRIKEAITSQPSQVDMLMELNLVARFLERLADHTTNIAKEVIYLVEGEITRHGFNTKVIPSPAPYPPGVAFTL